METVKCIITDLKLACPKAIHTGQVDLEEGRRDTRQQELQRENDLSPRQCLLRPGNQEPL